MSEHEPMDVTHREVTPSAEEPEKRRVGWPKGKPRGPRKQAEGEAAAAPARKRVRTRKPPTEKLGQIEACWELYERTVLDDRGELETEARKAYHSGMFDILMLIGKEMPANLPPAFMEWVQQCQRGMVSKA